MKRYHSYIVKNIKTGETIECKNQKEIGRAIECDPSTVSVYLRLKTPFKKTWLITGKED
jgi:hypothetical protein